MMDSQFTFISAMTTERNLEEAIDALAKQVNSQAEGRPLDLVFVFLSPHFTHSARHIAERLWVTYEPGVLLGCTAEGVIGREQEIEGEAGISVVAANLPGVELAPFLLQSNDWPVMLLDEDEFHRVVDAPEDSRLIIALGDPFSAPIDDILHAFNCFYSGIPMAGGMASGALRPHGNVLILNDRVLQGGFVGVALSGALDADIIVSQGCRPIWKPLKITAAQKNVIFSLEGQPPLAWIEELVPELSEDDRALLQNGLFVGRAINPQQEGLGRGDFLIRGVIGLDQQKGSIAIADYVQEGETIQFHLRDAYTAKEDLEMMLIPQVFRGPAAGGLLFSCNGRGMRLYDYPNGDISIIQRNLGELPLAGFFCAGEIGPIGGENFLHGHTASLVLLRAQASED